MASCICPQQAILAGQKLTMINEDDISYHRQRAADELNLGLSANSVRAARAHLRLSSLHFERARDMAGPVRVAVRPPFHLA